MICPSTFGACTARCCAEVVGELRERGGREERGEGAGNVGYGGCVELRGSSCNYQYIFSAHLVCSWNIHLWRYNYHRHYPHWSKVFHISCQV